MTFTLSTSLKESENKEVRNNCKPRSSNLELYRIICMLLIVAHHFATNSGLNALGGPIQSDPFSANSIYLRLFGMWGKTGINCFLLITGYFMCSSNITIRKFVKLFCQVLFYNVVIYTLFLVFGYETLNVRSVVKSVLPVWGFTDMFNSCFIAFYLFIPFLTILVRNLTKRQHQLLLLLLLGCYTIMGSVPSFNITFNYITWFSIVFIIASYIRLHPAPIFERKRFWGWLTAVLVLFAMISVIVLQKLLNSAYFLVADSNKIFAVAVAVSSFLWFKNLDIRHSKIINAIGASTFGVLLIHANSSAMRTWLWKDTVDCVGHYSLPLGKLILFSIGTVLIVFIACSIIDQLRLLLIEKPFFKWYDKRMDNKLKSLLKIE